jgi:acyl-CoA thioesterase
MSDDVEFTDYLGVRTLGKIHEAFVLELDLEPRHMSRAARVHGGVLFTLLDTALGRAVIEELPEGRGCATVELRINYFRPVQHGTVRASGRCVLKTRSLAYAEGDVVNDEGKLLARASGTFFLTDTLRQPDRERV